MWLKIMHSSYKKINENVICNCQQAIIWTNASILSIGPLGTNVNEIWIEIKNLLEQNAFQNVVYEMAAILSQPQCVNTIWHH